MGVLDARIRGGDGGEDGDAAVGVGGGEIGDLKDLVRGVGGNVVGIRRNGRRRAGHFDDDAFLGRRGSASIRFGFGAGGSPQGFGDGNVAGFGGGADQAAGPIHEKKQQGGFDAKDGGGKEDSGGLEKAMALAEALVRGDDVLELDEGLADFDDVAVAEFGGGIEDVVAVDANGVLRRQGGDEDAGGVFLEADMPGGDSVVARQDQVAGGIAAGQGDGLADDDALAFVASGLKNQSVHAVASVREGGAGRQFRIEGWLWAQSRGCHRNPIACGMASG